MVGVEAGVLWGCGLGGSKEVWEVWLSSECLRAPNIQGSLETATYLRCYDLQASF